MARIVSSSDNRHMTQFARVVASDLSSQHFRRCLIERGRWAVSDAHPQTGSAIIAARSRLGEGHPRALSVAAVRDATGKFIRAGESRQLAPAS
jgi:hypothetical protein